MRQISINMEIKTEAKDENMKKTKMLILAAALTLPLTANAAIISGWGSYVKASTQGNCSNGSCSGGGGTYANDGLFDGGSASANVRLSDEFGSAQAYSALTGTGYTPILRATSTAEPASGAFAIAYAVQGYTYTGAADTTLRLDISLHGINSSDAADIRGDVAILRGNSLQFYPHFATEVYEFGYDMIDTFEGKDSIESIFMSSVGESTMNSFIDINLSNGDDFFVVSSLSARSFIGATADASNTLTMQFSGAGAAGLRAASVSAVPVPAAVWLFGSGLIGLMGFARRKA